MKTTQVVSGFLLGTSLLIPSQFASAQAVFEDGGVHTIADDSLQNQYVIVRNSTTLRLVTGALFGGAFNELGTMDVLDTSTVTLAGGQIGVGGGSSGLVTLFDSSQFVLESGVVGGEAASSGQVVGFGQSRIVVLGGQVGGAGEQSGLIGLFDTALGEIRGGTFGGGGANSGLVLGFGTSLWQVFACQSDRPFGPVNDLSGNITGTTRSGAALDVPFMQEAAGLIELVEDCDDDGGVDTDGDGVLDDADACIESDLRPTLWLFNINTRIPNLIDGQVVNAAGCSLNDLVNAMIQEASERSRNRREFVWLVAQGLLEMKRDGLLPNRLLGHLNSCANRCNWEDGRRRGHDHRHQRLNWRRHR